MPPETKHATVTWRGRQSFTAEFGSLPPTVIDGHSGDGPSPMIALLYAAAGCTAIDVLMILEKMRLTVDAFSVEIAGTRRVEEPRRYVALHLVYRLRGSGLDDMKVRRAIDLSLEKYCSVMQSLAGDMAITYDVAVSGER